MKKWKKITDKLPNVASQVLLLQNDGSWLIGERKEQGSKGFVIFNKIGNSTVRNVTHWCPVQYPGEPE